VEENFQRRFSVNQWCGIFGDLNLLDFFIFIRNFRDNVYLTPPGTQKDSASMSGKTPKFFTDCKGGHF
jgi:hypothetical protein